MADKKKTITKKTVRIRASHLTKSEVSGIFFGPDGKVKGDILIPKNIFAVKANDFLLAQAVRIYRTNQRAYNASTKTRGEVRGSTRKIYRQKGTGRARHGDIKAPIFVGGGIALGPQKRLVRLELPKKLHKKALACALSRQFENGNIHIIDGLEKLIPKTKEFARIFNNMGISGNTLLILTKKDKSSILRAVKNLPLIDITYPHCLNPYSVLSHKKLLFTKTSLEELSETFVL